MNDLEDIIEDIENRIDILKGSTKVVVYWTIDGKKNRLEELIEEWKNIRIDIKKNMYLIIDLQKIYGIPMHQRCPKNRQYNDVTTNAILSLNRYLITLKKMLITVNEIIEKLKTILLEKGEDR